MLPVCGLTVRCPDWRLENGFIIPDLHLDEEPGYFLAIIFGLVSDDYMTAAVISNTPYYSQGNAYKIDGWKCLKLNFGSAQESS